MKIATIHHHLNRGGVTSVVINHVRALNTLDLPDRPTDVLILHGGRAQGWPDLATECSNLRIQTASVGGLDYDDRDELRVDELAAAIAGALQCRGFAPHEAILHVHNHSLGKNVSLPGALRELARQGYRLLLHIHDFAEDLRPANFQRFSRSLGDSLASQVGQYVYPSADHIHYALLNRRDWDIVRDTGIDADRVHLLPNPVTAAASLPAGDQARRRFASAHGLDGGDRVILYPVRGIRRKNVGELLLWSAISDDRTVFALTLPATSAHEIPSYERWRRLASALDLRVLFDVGLCEGISFEDNISAADRIITTSVAEGFGLTFLESWLHGKMLVGRDLPEITQDFSGRGVNLEHLGASVQIPIEWIGADDFVDHVLAIQTRLAAVYGRELSASARDVVQGAVDSGQVDFAALPVPQQIATIQRVAGDRRWADSVLEANPWMQRSLDDKLDWSELIETNAAAVRKVCSLESTAADLAGIYGSLMQSPGDGDVTPMPEAEHILDAFLDIRRLNPVRVEAPESL